MTKIKRFIYSMIACVFAFVLAIGGIGIKSAKVASANENTDSYDGFISGSIHELFDFPRGTGGNGKHYIIIDGTFLDGYTSGTPINELWNDPFMSIICSEISDCNNWTVANSNSFTNKLEEYDIELVIYFEEEFTKILNPYNGGENIYSVQNSSEFLNSIVETQTHVGNFFSAIVKWPMDGLLHRILTDIQVERGGEYTDMRACVYPTNGQIIEEGTFWIKEYLINENLLMMKQVPGGN